MSDTCPAPWPSATFLRNLCWSLDDHGTKASTSITIKRRTVDDTFFLSKMASNSNSIPVMYKPANAMETGPNGSSLQSAAARSHPIDVMQRRVAANPYGSLEFVRHVYGSGLAMRLATEQKMAREQDVMARAPGLETSGLFGEIISGRDTTIDFSDYLSLPQYRPLAPVENPHFVMERRLGMHD
ncbi:expressed unknown protein [Seminavis robusta]|uniref:Proteasome maturation factor UMP1 n=1 Tax=Seminavis robusta TaxID=568900 RepID=A0A9N8E133_9STRA|nr:expressed unknown protein [Seminavis robusta]|eukprot:Sro544_g163660.1 n/a (184) ;mRNA; f:28771-29412